MGVPLNHPFEKDLKNNDQPAIGDPPFMEIPTFIGYAFLKPMDLGILSRRTNFPRESASFRLEWRPFCISIRNWNFLDGSCHKWQLCFFIFNCDVRLMVFLMGFQDNSMDSLSVENDGLLWALRRLGFLWRITSSNSCGHPLVNWHSCGKSPSLIGKSTIDGPFQ